MRRAQVAILRHGGAARANVFTRITLALFGQLPWRATPFIPAEIIFFPKWFFFHLSKVSYWSRTVMVPLFILCTRKPVADNPRRVDIQELFIVPPEQLKTYFYAKGLCANVFLWLDRFGKLVEPLLPRKLRDKAVEACKQWSIRRMNEEHGIGGIFPAMVNVLESLVILGHDAKDPLRQQARKAVDNLLVRHDAYTYCQPCVSPVWDTCLAAQAMIEAEADPESITAALDWLRERQLDKEPGDWRDARPKLAGGGWAFQYSNYHYPDLDDTAMVGWAMCLHDRDRYRESIARAAHWLAGMRSKKRRLRLL